MRRWHIERVGSKRTPGGGKPKDHPTDLLALVWREVPSRKDHSFNAQTGFVHFLRCEPIRGVMRRAINEAASL